LGLTLGIGFFLVGAPGWGVVYGSIAALGIVGLLLDGYFTTGNK
jgi:hypothetical protein